MPSPVDIEAVFIARRVGEAIESAGGAYFVGGSLASSLQGDPRSTNDIDMVIDLSADGVTAFVSALGSDFDVDIEMLRQALASRQSCNIFFLPSFTKVDLFPLGSSPFDLSEFSRRQRVVVDEGGALLVLKSAEDTVLRKLLWYRMGGEVSDRQWRDVVEVLKVSGAGLDAGYLTTWAEQLGLEPLLARAQRDASGG